MDILNGSTQVAIDPVHEDERGWWFWDETWAWRLGPFVTEEGARRHLGIYGDWLEGNHETDTTRVCLWVHWECPGELAGEEFRGEDPATGAGRA